MNTKAAITIFRAELDFNGKREELIRINGSVAPTKNPKVGELWLSLYCYGMGEEPPAGERAEILENPNRGGFERACRILIEQYNGKILENSFDEYADDKNVKQRLKIEFYLNGKREVYIRFDGRDYYSSPEAERAVNGVAADIYDYEGHPKGFDPWDLNAAIVERYNGKILEDRGGITPEDVKALYNSALFKDPINGLHF